jgi:hypothetical protein
MEQCLFLDALVMQSTDMCSDEVAPLFALLYCGRGVPLPQLASTFHGSSGLAMRVVAKWPTIYIFRPTCGTLLAFVAHSNLVLPLVLLVPFQLATLLAGMYYMRHGVVCWYALSAEALQLEYCCGQLQRTMRGIGVLFTGIKSLSVVDADGGVCPTPEEPLSAAIVVLLFALVVVLFLLPVFVTACLEWSLKDRYVEHELQQQMLWPFPKSAFCGAAVFLSLVVSSWFGCEWAVLRFPPLTCSAAHELLLQPLQQL